MSGKAMLPRAGKAAPLTAQQLREHTAHPEWFHVTGKGDLAQINVNLARMPTPQRSLAATATGFAREGQTVSLIFGQTLPGAARMTGALQICMPAVNVYKALYTNEEFRLLLNGFAEQHHITPTLRAPDPGSYPTERTVTERASFAAMAFNQEDAEVRFYRISPSDLRALHQGEKAELVYPLVEVILATDEFVHVVHSLCTLVPKSEQFPQGLI